MAPTEAAVAAPGPSQAELTDALAGRSDWELREMGGRLARGIEQLAAGHEELLLEREDLRAEQEQLICTIKLMLHETLKLNIGGENTIEPMLEEGPLNFVGRYWELLRPRNNQVLISDNIGELKWVPHNQEDVNTSIGERLEQFNATASDRVQNLRGFASTQFQEMQNTTSEHVAEFVKSLGEAWEERHDVLPMDAASEQISAATQALNEARSQLSHAVSSMQTRPVWQEAMDGWPSLAAWGTSHVFRGATEHIQEDDEEVPPEMALGVPRHMSVDTDDGCVMNLQDKFPASVGAAQQRRESGQRMDEEQRKLDAIRALKKKRQEEEEEEQQRRRREEAVDVASLMIEAWVKLDDGSIQVARVGARDRCKDVAALFVKEHCLKAWFEEPLARYLIEVESETEHFPAKVEADLLEIRKQYCVKR